MTVNESESNPLVMLCSCQHELEAQSLSAILEEAGIFAVVNSSPFTVLSCAIAPGSEVTLRVPQDQLELAKQALEISRIHAATIDWDEVDLGEMPPEVENLIQQREVIHGFARFLAVTGMILGLLILLVFTAGIVYISF
ncbi:MAG: hypothetical protein CMJ53_04400 [Planctomycetaceae bacterium]|nr:hypothetical protein [Planctomycetaceae bacterium]